jgi:hypothetical protein
MPLYRRDNLSAASTRAANMSPAFPGIAFVKAFCRHHPGGDANDESACPAATKLSFRKSTPFAGVWRFVAAAPRLDRSP